MLRNEKVFTISNFLSILRILLLPVILYFLNQNTTRGNLFALFVMLLAILTDFLDGFLARKLHQKSNLGRILDPVADKICLATIIIYLVMYRGFPLWFLMIVVLRDVLIMAFGFYIIQKRKFVSESNLAGKITSGVLAFLIVTYCIQLHPLDQVLLWLGLAMVIISSLGYFNKFLLIMRSGIKIS